MIHGTAAQNSTTPAPLLSWNCQKGGIGKNIKNSAQHPKLLSPRHLTGHTFINFHPSPKKLGLLLNPTANLRSPQWIPKTSRHETTKTKARAWIKISSSCLSWWKPSRRKPMAVDVPVIWETYLAVFGALQPTNKIARWRRNDTNSTTSRFSLIVAYHGSLKREYIAPLHTIGRPI